MWSRWLGRSVMLVFLLVMFTQLKKITILKQVYRENLTGEMESDDELDKERASVTNTEPLIQSHAPGVAECHCTRNGLHVPDAEMVKRDAKDRQWFLKSFSFEDESTCSDFSTQRGANQRVVTYSYYSHGKTDPNSKDFKKYLGQLHGTIGRIKQLYPEWLVRIYHNVSSADGHAFQELCRIQCDFGFVDLCNVLNLPGLGNLVERGVVGRMWRFSVMGDPTVEAFLIRDTDSWILQREVVAVEQWLQSGRTYHIMHDLPGHRYIIMAGLWGGINKYPDVMRNLRDQIFNRTTKPNKLSDQWLLEEIVWPVIKSDVMNHDSYTCNLHTNSSAVPFPTKRVSYKYCGWSPFRTYGMKLIRKTPCPVACRPPDHLDWRRC